VNIETKESKKTKDAQQDGVYWTIEEIYGTVLTHRDNFAFAVEVCKECGKDSVGKCPVRLFHRTG
jgi:hypothetical protein